MWVVTTIVSIHLHIDGSLTTRPNVPQVVTFTYNQEAEISILSNTINLAVDYIRIFLANDFAGMPQVSVSECEQASKE